MEDGTKRCHPVQGHGTRHLETVVGHQSSWEHFELKYTVMSGRLGCLGLRDAHTLVKLRTY